MGMLLVIFSGFYTSMFETHGGPSSGWHHYWGWYRGTYWNKAPRLVEYLSGFKLYLIMLTLFIGGFLIYILRDKKEIKVYQDFKILEKINFKKIIKRESLVILIWILATYVLAFTLGTSLNLRYSNKYMNYVILISAMAFWSYLVHWLIRFIFWAIRTLKGGQVHSLDLVDKNG